MKYLHNLTHRLWAGLLAAILLPALRHWNYRRKGALTHFVWDLVCSK